MNEGHWVELPDKPATDDEPATMLWHIIKEAGVTNGTYQVETFCGIVAPWNGTFVDRLAGGGGHEACISAQTSAAAKEARAAEKETKTAAASGKT